MQRPSPTDDDESSGHHRRSHRKSRDDSGKTQSTSKRRKSKVLDSLANENGACRLCCCCGDVADVAHRVLWLFFSNDSASARGQDDADACGSDTDRDQKEHVFVLQVWQRQQSEKVDQSTGSCLHQRTLVAVVVRRGVCVFDLFSCRRRRAAM